MKTEIRSADSWPGSLVRTRLVATDNLTTAPSSCGSRRVWKQLRACKEMFVYCLQAFVAACDFSSDSEGSPVSPVPARLAHLRSRAIPAAEAHDAHHVAGPLRSASRCLLRVASSPVPPLSRGRLPAVGIDSKTWLGEWTTNWSGWSWARSEEERASGWAWSETENLPMSEVEGEGVTNPAIEEMEVESKKELEPEAEGAQVDEKPRWKQRLEKHPGILTTAATEAFGQLSQNEFDKIPTNGPSEQSTPWKTPRPTPWVPDKTDTSLASLRPSLVP